jgi:hypothetical protein
MAKLNPPTSNQKMVNQENSKALAHETIQAATPKKPTKQTPPSAIKPLQLKIPEHKKNEFKAYAAMHGQSMNTLFLDMFDEYKSTHC